MKASTQKTYAKYSKWLLQQKKEMLKKENPMEEGIDFNHGRINLAL